MIPSRILFAPYALENLMLANRIVMAPMTRCRMIAPSYAPRQTTKTYYTERASAGLIVSEGIVVSRQARGYSNTPGLYTATQVRAWKRVTDAVHRRGGHIVAQLWHCGRISHSSLLPRGAAPVGASDVAANIMTFHLDKTGREITHTCSQPRALTTSEVRGITQEFVEAAQRAMAAGFDGVEIHGANGYLFDQFRCPYLNQRTDEYGGSLENRCRLLLQTTAAVELAIGPGRTGVRLSPMGRSNDMLADPQPEITYGYLAEQLNLLGTAYLHLNDQDGHWIHDADSPLLRRLRESFKRTLILCGGFDGARAEAALKANCGDLIAFGKPFISNPDLVDRLCKGHELTPYDQKTFYQSGSAGYVDYPALSQPIAPANTRPRSTAAGRAYSPA